MGEGRTVPSGCQWTQDSQTVLSREGRGRSPRGHILGIRVQGNGPGVWDWGVRHTCRAGGSCRARQCSHTVLVLRTPKQHAGDELLIPPDLLLGQLPVLGHAQEGLGCGLSPGRVLEQYWLPHLLQKCTESAAVCGTIGMEGLRRLSRVSGCTG